MAAFPLPPGSTIGILGGGQLGRMLALAAARLGFDTAILTPEENSPASRVAARTIVAAYDDATALEILAAETQVVTFEFENVPAAAVERLAALGAEVAPGAKALAVAQDRLEEKTFLNAAGVADRRLRSRGHRRRPGPRGSPASGDRCCSRRRRGGYDGKGQAWVSRPDDAEAALAEIGHRPAIAEAPADFRRELAVIAARGRDGEIALYPLTENHHEHGVLRRTSAPAKASPRTLAEAERIAATLLTALDYVGVIGIELFERDDGTPAGQRVRAPGAQHRPLDPGRLRGRPVRTAYPRHRRLAAWAYRALWPRSR